MNYRQVHVKAGSPEWLEWRKTGLGASLAPVIMGNSPYQTPRELAEELLGLAPPRPVNVAMRRGQAFEADALKILNMLEPEEDQWVPGVCLESARFDYILASLDGFKPWSSRVLEIKMVGKKDFESIKFYETPLAHHRDQLVQQAFVAGVDEVEYMAYVVEGDKISDVTKITVKNLRSEAQRVIDSVTDFWGLIKAGKLPDFGPRDRVELVSTTLEQMLEERWSLKESRRELDEQIEACERDIWNFVGDDNAEAYGYTFTTVTRKGSINYKNIPQLKGVDLEAYRSKPITFKTIRGNNEKEES